MTEQKLVPYRRRHRLVPDDGIQRARAAAKRAQAAILKCGCQCARCVAAAVDLAEVLRILPDDGGVAASRADAATADGAPSSAKEVLPTDGNAVSATPSAVIGTASARSARTSEPVSGKHQGGAQRAHQAAEGDRDAKRRGRVRAGPGREPSG